jgi:hypothetical protein
MRWVLEVSGTWLFVHKPGPVTLTYKVIFPRPVIHTFLVLREDVTTWLFTNIKMRSPREVYQGARGEWPLDQISPKRLPLFLTQQWRRRLVGGPGHALLYVSGVHLYKVTWSIYLEMSFWPKSWMGFLVRGTFINEIVSGSTGSMTRCHQGRDPRPMKKRGDWLQVFSEERFGVNVLDVLCKCHRCARSVSVKVTCACTRATLIPVRQWLNSHASVVSGPCIWAWKARTVVPLFLLFFFFNSSFKVFLWIACTEIFGEPDQVLLQWCILPMSFGVQGKGCFAKTS